MSSFDFFIDSDVVYPTFRVAGDFPGNWFAPAILSKGGLSERN